MDTKDLKLLLEQYWEGNTSPDQEQALKAWFRENPVPEGLERDAQLFNYYSIQNDIKISDDFEDRILNELTVEDTTETSTKTVSMWSSVLNWRAAAVISGIIVATVVLKNPFGSSNVGTDTYEDPKDAYEATKAILMTISANMNKGKAYTQQLTKFSEVQKKISEVDIAPKKEGS